MNALIKVHLLFHGTAGITNFAHFFMYHLTKTWGHNYCERFLYCCDLCFFLLGIIERKKPEMDFHYTVLTLPKSKFFLISFNFDSSAFRFATDKIYMYFSCSLALWGIDVYAFPSSVDAYSDWQLTLNFELWVEFFCVLTCFPMRIPK